MVPHGAPRLHLPNLVFIIILPWVNILFQKLSASFLVYPLTRYVGPTPAQC